MSKKPYKDPHTGIFIYHSLPQGVVQATESDIWMQNGHALNKKVLVQSFYSNLFHVYKITQPIFNHPLRDFIKENKVYIKP